MLPALELKYNQYYIYIKHIIQHPAGMAQLETDRLHHEAEKKEGDISTPTHTPNWHRMSCTHNNVCKLRFRLPRFNILMGRFFDKIKHNLLNITSPQQLITTCSRTRNKSPIKYIQIHASIHTHTDISIQTLHPFQQALSTIHLVTPIDTDRDCF